jgi:hypothetical protein
MIDPAQIAWLLQSITYGFQCSFSHVCFEESRYASHLSALCQGFPFQIIPLIGKIDKNHSHH